MQKARERRTARTRANRMVVRMDFIGGGYFETITKKGIGEGLCFADAFS